MPAATPRSLLTSRSFAVEQLLCRRSRARADLVARAEQLGAFVSIGTSEKSPRLFLNFHTPIGRDMWPIAINPGLGKLVLFLRFLKSHPAFADEAVRAELVDRMEQATGVKIQGDNLGGFPFFPVQVVTEAGAIQQIIEVLEWAVAVASSPAPPTV